MSDRYESEETHRARIHAMRSLALDATLAEIVRLLGSRRIEPVLLKGAGTARWLYEHVYERGYNDIDLLIAPEQFDAAVTALREIGFAPVWSGSSHDAVTHHVGLSRSDPLPVQVELHHTLYLISAPESKVWRALTEDLRTIEIEGERVSVPAPPAAAMIVVLHAVQHGIAAERPMADLVRAVERVDLPSWRAAAELAQTLGAGDVFAAGLRLTPAGRAIADQLGLSVDSVTRRVRLRAMTAPDTAMGVERMIAAEGVRARVRLLIYELFPPTGFMRVWHPLARRGTLGLACAYLWRPFWLMGKLPAGIHAWMKADRATRRD